MKSCQALAGRVLSSPAEGSASTGQSGAVASKHICTVSQEGAGHS